MDRERTRCATEAAAAAAERVVLEAVAGEEAAALLRNDMTAAEKRAEVAEAKVGRCRLKHMFASTE
jgi:hypothetical protein